MILALYAVEKLAAEQIPMNPLPPAGGEGRVRGAAPTIAASPSHPNPLLRWGRGGKARTAEDWSRLAPLLDRLGARLGLEALSRLEAHESHIPERASIYVAMDTPSPPPGAERVGVRRGIAERSSRPTSPSHRCAMGPSLSPLKGGEGLSDGPSGKPPRPIRLFAPPEPIEATWLLPDDPPFHFTWRRRLHRVRRAEGPERIAEEWWVAGGSLAADALRDYYRVEDAEGRRFWLFRAGLPGFNGNSGPPPRWFVHGVFA
jgi:protein ImuB